MRIPTPVPARIVLSALAASGLLLAGCGGDTPTAPTAVEPDLGAPATWISDTTGAVAGMVFDDRNQNGILDDGESGLAGATVEIAYPTGITDRVLTDATGQYVFDDLAPAWYIVSAPQIAGWTSTTPLNAFVSVVAATITEVDHGLYTDNVVPETGSIAGTVFDDADRDGVQDFAEWGLAGLTVTLVDADGAVLQAQTDTDGRYLFDELVTGAYTVDAPTPEDRELTTPTGVLVEVSGAPTTGVDFGLAPLQDEPDDPDGLATIAGVVFSDLDGDGRRDPGEPGIAGVQVRLGPAGRAPDGAAPGDRGRHRLATTDADGNYVFEELQAGRWRAFARPGAGHHPHARPGLEISVQAGDSVEDADLGLVPGHRPEPTG